MDTRDIFASDVNSSYCLLFPVFFHPAIFHDWFYFAQLFSFKTNSKKKLLLEFEEIRSGEWNSISPNFLKKGQPLRGFPKFKETCYRNLSFHWIFLSN